MRPPANTQAPPALRLAAARAAVGPAATAPLINCELVRLPLSSLVVVHPIIAMRNVELNRLPQPLAIPQHASDPDSLLVFLLAGPPWVVPRKVRGEHVYQIIFGEEYLPLLRRHHPPTLQVPVLMFQGLHSHEHVLRISALATAGVLERGRIQSARDVQALLQHAPGSGWSPGVSTPKGTSVAVAPAASMPAPAASLTAPPAASAESAAKQRVSPARGPNPAHRSRPTGKARLPGSAVRAAPSGLQAQGPVAVQTQVPSLPEAAASVVDSARGAGGLPDGVKPQS